jgi:ABC-type sugar transport system substrate-binding protein
MEPECRGVSVCFRGSQNFDDLDAVKRAVLGLNGDCVVLHRGTPGVAEAAELAAGVRGLETSIHRARVVRKPSKRAANVDEKMIAECQMLYAFWDGTSLGTAKAIETAQRLGKEVIVVARKRP